LYLNNLPEVREEVNHIFEVRPHQSEYLTNLGRFGLCDESRARFSGRGGLTEKGTKEITCDGDSDGDDDGY
jgi:hypothetical protein